MKTTTTLLFYLALLAVLSGCTTMQTTYFRGSFQPLEDTASPGFLPASGDAQFRMVSDMGQGAEDMYNEGYAMIGYSQFVSPLYTSLAPGYATKYANMLGAGYAVMETPQPGASNLHGYLVTYWVRVRPEAFGIGTYSSDLPDNMLDRLGREYNVVYLKGVVPGTPAASAGLKRNDVVLAVDGERVTSAVEFLDRVREKWGEEATVSVSRYGKHLQIPVRVREPAVSSTGFSYHDKPWLNTAPTDWSSLSAANTTARVLQQQQQQREIEAAYERGRQQAYAATAYADSDVYSAYDRYGRVPYTRQDRRRGIEPPPNWSRDFRGAMDRYQDLDFTVMQGDSLSMYFDNYPSVYGHLYSYPAN
jgi:hypothetical protein